MKKIIRLNETELSNLIRKVISEEKGKIKTYKKTIKEDLNEVDFNYEDDKEPTEEEIVEQLDLYYKYMENLYNDAFDEINEIDSELASELSKDALSPLFSPHDLSSVLHDLSQEGPKHLSILADEIEMLQADIEELEHMYEEIAGPPPNFNTKWSYPEE